MEWPLRWGWTDPGSWSVSWLRSAVAYRLAACQLTTSYCQGSKAPRLDQSTPKVCQFDSLDPWGRPARRHPPGPSYYHFTLRLGLQNFIGRANFCYAQSHPKFILQAHLTPLEDQTQSACLHCSRSGWRFTFRELYGSWVRTASIKTFPLVIRVSN